MKQQGGNNEKEPKTRKALELEAKRRRERERKIQLSMLIPDLHKRARELEYINRNEFWEKFWDNQQNISAVPPLDLSLLVKNILGVVIM